MQARLILVTNLTKYVVGAKAKPPKKPRTPPKKGNVIAINMVSAVYSKK